MNSRLPTPEDVGAMYDRATDIFAEVLGGNLHFGYWEDDQDPASVEQATNLMTDMVAEQLALRPGHRVLDIGCGSGKPAVRIAAARNVHVTGVTISTRQVEQAMARPEAGDSPGQAAFQLADAARLPFPDSSFDAAYAVESMVHMPDQPAVLAEAARVLRPGGRLVIVETYRVGELDAEGADAVAQAFEVYQLATLIDADEYRDRLTRAGFRLEVFRDIGRNVRRSAEAVREAALAFDGAEREQLLAAAELAALYGDPPVSYGLMVALRA